MTVKQNLSSQFGNFYFFKEKNGPIWISSYYGLNRYDGKEIKNYLPSKDNQASLAEGEIIGPILKNGGDGFWTSTNRFIYSYDRKSDQFTRYNLAPPYEQNTSLLYFDAQKKELWLNNNNQLLITDSENFRHITRLENLNGVYGRGLTVIKKDTSNAYYLLFPKIDGFDFKFYQNKKIVSTKTYPKEKQHQSNVNAFLYSKEEEVVWAATGKGLLEVNLKNEKSFLFNSFKNSTLSNIVGIQALNKDNLIVATQNQGIYIFNLTDKRFASQIYNKGNKYVEPFEVSIKNIFLDEQNTLWVHSPANGVYFANLQRNKFQSLFQRNIHEPKFKNNSGGMAIDSKNRLWAICPEGIFVFDENGNQFSTFNHLSGDINPLKGKQSYYLFCDLQDRIWIISETGLYLLVPPYDKIQSLKLDKEKLPPVIYINQLNTGEIFFSTYLNGISQLVEKNGNFSITPFTPFYTNETFGYSFVGEKMIISKTGSDILIFDKDNNYQVADTSFNLPSFVTGIVEINNGKNYWVTTAEGLYSISHNKGAFTFTQDTIFPYQNLKSLLVDSLNNLWISSTNKIIKYNPTNKIIQEYLSDDGLQSKEFVDWSCAQINKDVFIFGGEDGINIFNPYLITSSNVKVNPKITSLIINDQTANDELGKYEVNALNILELDSIKLPFDKRTLSFRFSAMDFISPNSNQFKYRLDPTDTAWVVSKTENFARYPNLEPKTYTFEVDATNADGIWSNTPAQLMITIHPPWYKTWWSYTTYLLLTILALYSAYRFQLNQRLKSAEAYRLKELDRVKTALYTNITHEFRTPLTVILGMADQIKQKPKKGLQEGVAMIRRSGQHLLGLVNQMLDLAKIESGNMQAEYVQGDIGTYCQYLVESYQSYAASKQINLVFYNEIGELVMDYDADKLQAIVTNLLSNATKFTPENGKIIVHLNRTTDQEDQLVCQLKIKDTGIGIAEKDVPHIFDRFYQADDKTTRSTGGTGIGLALTRELVELMEGTISVNSQLDKGTEFIILLPINRNAPLTKEVSNLSNWLHSEEASEGISIGNTPVSQLQTTTYSKEKDELPLVLLIEDNLDILTYLQSCLEGNYRVILALNGQVGIDRALEEIPDIIITDVMMPKKDGFEVCATLKQNEQTSHIPVIMLTAKAHIDDKITGLSKGADAYLSKPFHQGELEVRLAQLLAQRKRLQEYYTNQSLQATPAKIDPFLQRIIDLVELDLMADLSIPALSKKMTMDQATIFRKIKALTGESTALYVRRIRLKNAHHLLLSTDLTIAEIGYAVGFKDPAFFSRSFSKLYGKAPSIVRNEKGKI